MADRDIHCAYWRNHGFDREQKAEILKEHGRKKAIPFLEVQVALLTANINGLQGHFKATRRSPAVAA